MDGRTEADTPASLSRLETFYCIVSFLIAESDKCSSVVCFSLFQHSRATKTEVETKQTRDSNFGREASLAPLWTTSVSQRPPSCTSGFHVQVDSPNTWLNSSEGKKKNDLRLCETFLVSELDVIITNVKVASWEPNLMFL